MNRVIMDVDTGIDDAIAILLACASDDLDLIGITTVSGNVNVTKATRNTLRILKMIGKEDIPVYMGSAEPLIRPLVDASQVHGAAGLGGQLENIEVSLPAKETAIEFLKQSIRTYGEDLTIITTGPMTNLARVLKEAPSLAEKIGRVISMGGVVAGRGNHTPVAEFNILTDPEAADLVFNAGIKDFTLIGLDVTRKALLRKNDLDRVAGESIRTFLERVTHHYMNRYSRKTGFLACPMHDPLTVLYYLDPEILKTSHEPVMIETNSRFCDGMTVCDFDGHLGFKPNVHVALKIDIERFEMRLFELLNRMEGVDV